MKIGKLELQDEWHVAESGTYYKLKKGTMEACVGLYNMSVKLQHWNILYLNSLCFLVKTDCAPHGYVGSLREVQNHIDNFLRKIDKLIAFL